MYAQGDNLLAVPGTFQDMRYFEVFGQKAGDNQVQSLCPHQKKYIGTILI